MTVSKDESDYGFIHTNLEAPQTKMVKLTISAFVTICSIVVLDSEDYIEIDNEQYFIADEFTDLNPISLADILTGLLQQENIEVEVSNSNRLEFHKSTLLTDGSVEFEITGASYRMKLITGMYNTEFPIQGEGLIKIQSVGFYLSTPILYLISNLGASCYQNIERKYCDQKVVMRIINSFSANLPIIANNAEFAAIVVSNALGDIWFQLVDMYMQPVKILTPIIVTAMCSGIPDEIEELTQEG
jgi:hypothetical protein